MFRPKMPAVNYIKVEKTPSAAEVLELLEEIAKEFITLKVAISNLNHVKSACDNKRVNEKNIEPLYSKCLLLSSLRVQTLEVLIKKFINTISQNPSLIADFYAHFKQSISGDRNDKNKSIESIDYDKPKLS